MSIPQPEPGLLRRAQQGDEKAFATLVGTYHAPVYNYVLRVLGSDRPLAEDLTQEIFLRVHQGLKGFSHNSRFTTWLFQIAKNRALDELRARERRGPIPIDIESVPNSVIAREPQVGVEDMDSVFRAIAALQPDLKMALLLRDVVGLSYHEIADTLEITLATTKWRIYKARELAAARLVSEGVLRLPSEVPVSA